MLSWLIHNNKDAPDFYKRYLAKFDKKPNRFVILRTNSSGKNPEKDVLFSIGAVSVVNDQIILADSFEIMIYQYKYLHDQGLSNDFIVASKLPKKHEPAALEDFINFILSKIEDMKKKFLSIYIIIYVCACVCVGEDYAAISKRVPYPETTFIIWRSFLTGMLGMVFGCT